MTDSKLSESSKPSSSNPTKQRIRLHREKPLQLTGSEKGVWLVKVPKYMSEKLTAAAPGAEVGRLKICQTVQQSGSGAAAKRKSEVVFSLSADLAREGDRSVPPDAKFVMTAMSGQQMHVLSETVKVTPDGSELPVASVDGKIVQRAVCVPHNDSSYMELKKSQIIEQNQSTKEVKQLSKPHVPTVRPVISAFSGSEQKREQKQKLSKEKVQELLFGAFEKHQYYNLRDLAMITKQPLNYLREILNEIATTSKTGLHRNMWELKAEFRHYERTGEAGAS